MEDQNINEIPAYIKDNVSRIFFINGFYLYYKAPSLKNNEYKCRCRKTVCKYFIKINRENFTKFSNKENYTEYNQHSSYIEKLINNDAKYNIRSVEEELKLANSLIKQSIKQLLVFRLANFKNNKSYGKK